jgi:hypothetical protein
MADIERDNDCNFRSLQLRILLLLVVLIHLSCKSKARLTASSECRFYKDELKIVGDDHTAKDIIVKNISPHYAIKRLLPYRIGMDTLAIDRNCHLLADNYKQLNYSILSCNNVEQAEQVLLEVILDSFPYSIIDTVVTIHNYKVNVVDSFLFYPNERKATNRIDFNCEYYNDCTKCMRKNIDFNHFVYCTIKDELPTYSQIEKLDEIGGRFDFEWESRIYDNHGFDAFKLHLKQLFGCDLSLSSVEYRNVLMIKEIEDPKYYRKMNKTLGKYNSNCFLFTSSGSKYDKVVRSYD